MINNDDNLSIYNILNPIELEKYLKNNLQTNSEFIDNIINTKLNDKLIIKLINLIKIHLKKYGVINHCKNPKNIQNKHIYFIQEAQSEAKKSILNHKHGCVIVYRNQIITRGHNKVLNFNNSFKSIHAEIDALLKLTKINKFTNKNIRNNCTLYIVRIQNGSGKLKMSKPCINCINNIIKNNIGVTYYSTNKTFIDDLICQYIKFI
jgi:deoxycytidylate deaminase|tara:strand:- start:676 stop:1293 length:618 start_codon:yes stop_codon:yes gene_type:complete